MIESIFIKKKSLQVLCYMKTKLGEVYFLDPAQAETSNSRLQPMKP